MKLSSQQDKASPRTQAACSRAGTGRRSNALLAAIKSLAADIAAIKLAVPAVNNEEDKQRSQSPAVLHNACTSSSFAAQQWEGTSESTKAQMEAKTTGSVQLLKQGRRSPMQVPYTPTVLVHLHEMYTRPAKSSTLLASLAEPLLAASLAPAESCPYSTSAMRDPGPCTQPPSSATSPSAPASTVHPAISELIDASRRSSFFPPPRPLTPSCFSPHFPDNYVPTLDEMPPLVSRVKG
jgi:hypothetical protein